MVDPPPSREGDPPIVPPVPTVPHVETVHQPTPSPNGSDSPSPFQRLPHRFNQRLRGFSGFLSPIRNSIAPLFSVTPGQTPTTPFHPQDPVSTTRPPVTFSDSIPHVTHPCSSLANPIPQGSPVDQSSHPSFDWSLGTKEISYLNDHESSFPYAFLQSPYPEGLDFSKDCVVWLNLLNIFTWDAFVYHSTTYTVHSMMSTLSVPFYFKHREDLRLFFLFGIMYRSISSSIYPTIENFPSWKDHYRTFRRAYLASFQASEVQSQDLLFSEAQHTHLSQPVFPVPPRAQESPLPFASFPEPPSRIVPPSPSLSVPPPLFDASVTVPDVNSNGGDYNQLLLPLQFLLWFQFHQVYFLLNTRQMKYLTSELATNILSSLLLLPTKLLSIQTLESLSVGPIPFTILVVWIFHLIRILYKPIQPVKHVYETQTLPTNLLISSTTSMLRRINGMVLLLVFVRINRA